MQEQLAVRADHNKWRKVATGVLAPMTPANGATEFQKDFFMTCRRTDAGRVLPQYYLCYFLLVDLLGYPCAGPSEKTAWSIPLDYEGVGLTLEYRKFGLGIFATPDGRSEEVAGKVAERLRRACRASTTFFDWLAGEKLAVSQVSIMNRSDELFARYSFFRDQYEGLGLKAPSTESGDSHARLHGVQAWEQTVQSRWLALAAVESFFAWTEHVLVLIAAITGKATEAGEIAGLALCEWRDKCREALPLEQAEVARAYESAMELRRELRNYFAHGAFGKDSAAFSFHSSTGAVPVLLPHRARKLKFRFGAGEAFNAPRAFEVMDQFERAIWAGDRSPARQYIQDATLPIILPLAKDGTYDAAMSSAEAMEELISALEFEMDRAENMDF